MIEIEEAWRKYRWGPEQLSYLSAQIVDAVLVAAGGKSRPLEEILLKFGSAEEVKAERRKRVRENLDRMNANRKKEH